MSDLISKKAEIERVNNTTFSHNEAENTIIREFVRNFLYMSEPVYNVDKVIEQLEDLHETISADDWYAAEKVWEAIEIVKKGGIKE